MECAATGHLTPPLREYLARQEILFISSADGEGACHASVRSGPPGFVRVLDDRTLMFPRYARDGGLPGVEDVPERPVGLLFTDAFRTEGQHLHLGGRARLIAHAAVEAFAPMLRRMAGIEDIEDVVGGQRLTPAEWVLVSVADARLARAMPVPAGGGADEGSMRWAESLPAPEPDDGDELSYLLPPAWADA